MEKEVHLPQEAPDEKPVPNDSDRQLAEPAQELAQAQQEIAALKTQLRQAEQRQEMMWQRVRERWQETQQQQREHMRTLQSERDFALRVMNAMGQGVTVSDLQGLFVYVNPAYAAMIGYEASQLLGKTPYDVTHPDDQELLTQSFHRRLAGKSNSYQSCLQHRDGTAVHVLITAVPRWHNGQITGSIAAITDLSDRIQLEQLALSTRDEALEAARLKTEFLANMSHEIRTPLNAIIGMTGLLLDTTLSRDQYDFVQTIRHSGDSLLLLLNDILDVSKIDAGKLDLENHPFDLHRCVTEAMELLRKSADEKGLSMTLAVDESVPSSIVGDHSRLRQILVNLLSNAVKFTEQGAVTVTVSSHAKENGRFQIQFTVTDTGIGIPAAKLHSIFQSFHQVDASMTRRFGGTGLGLTISQELSRLMGGKMWVESTVGQGSAFSFTILVEDHPADEEVVALGDATRPLIPQFDPDMSQQHPLRILLAEDNVINQKVALSMLARLGYRAEVAANGSEVLAALERQPYDVILMDVQMPVMDGVAAAQQIRKSSQELPQPRIIAMTAHAMEGDREHYLSQGMDDYISKPVRVDELIAALYSCRTISQE